MCRLQFQLLYLKSLLRWVNLLKKKKKSFCLFPICCAGIQFTYYRYMGVCKQCCSFPYYSKAEKKDCFPSRCTKFLFEVLNYVHLGESEAVHELVVSDGDLQQSCSMTLVLRFG